jgi:carboxymethylenebutenolidase
MLRAARRIIIVVVVLLLGFIVFLAGSIIVDGFGSSRRLESVTNVAIANPAGAEVRAYVARPDGPGPHPAVIMIHEFFGLNDSIRAKADLLAESGYVVVAPDVFRGSTTAWIPRAIYQVVSAKPERVNADLDSVYVWLESQPEVDKERIAIAGFCYGGRTSLLYSLHNNRLAATVVFYGAPETDPDVLKNLPGPLLGIFGGADVSISAEDVQAVETGLTDAGIPHEITVYEGQPHAFVTDIQSIRAGGVQGEAWAKMLAFLNENLKGGSSRQIMQSIAYTTPFPWRYYAMLVYEHAFGTASHLH